MQDGEKIIGVRIGTPDDLGKVKELLPEERKKLGIDKSVLIHMKKICKNERI